MGLQADLALEQRAFLRRNRGQWAEHLERTRGFLGEGLRAAGEGRPVLILGAGSGLEVPWGLAPGNTVGWDADPWSRVRTCLRHRRWAPWVFEDLTGAMADLAATAHRAAQQPWSGRLRPTAKAALRLAGLLETLHPDPGPLRFWLQQHRPGTILAANVMGQFGVVAQASVEKAFGRRSPWVLDPELADPLEAALSAWTARVLRAFLAALGASGAELWLVHDRGVVFGEEPVTLAPGPGPWLAQLQARAPLEVSDPLCGVQVAEAFAGRTLDRQQLWLWPVASGQLHVMESLHVHGRWPGAPA